MMSVRLRAAASAAVVISVLIGALPALATDPALQDDPVLLERITPDFAMDLADADPETPMTCLVILDPPAVSGIKTEMPIPQLIQVYRQQAFAMQEGLLAEIEAEDPGAISLLDRHWLLNTIVMRAKPRQIRKVARKRKVRKLARGGQIRLIEPATGTLDGLGEGATWNVRQTSADLVWQAGFTGSGVIVGHLDTGADPNHPALAGKFAGHWFDAVNGEPTPYDDHGHGTHTLGVILGGDGPGPSPYDIGVAPAARWVGAKVMDKYGHGTYAQCLAGLESMVELKSSGVDVRVICSSWSLDDRGSDILAEVCATLLDLDVLPVFAVGNDGPDPSSCDVPASYPGVLAVGAVDQDETVAVFSSRGPAPAPPALASEPLMEGSGRHKPDIVAPGVDVVSAVPGGGYAAASGTSSAAPHVAGVAALLLDKNPDLRPHDLAAALLGHARPSITSAAGPDDTAGWGLLDAMSAIRSIPGGTFTAVGSTEPARNPSLLEVRSGTGAGVLVRYALDRGVDGTVEIYDLAGRLVRRLPVLGDGSPRETRWDGADARGRRVTSGVYVARLKGEGVVATRSFALVR